MAKVNVARKLKDAGERLRHPESFLGPLLTLTSGTIVAHLITAATLLALARIYTPDDFGVSALFSSIFFILSVIVCLRFDVAIPLPEDETEARALLALSLAAACGCAVAASVLVAAVPDAWLGAVGLEKLLPHLWLMPVALWSTGVLMALQSWAVRRKAFRLISGARVAQSAGASVVQVAVGMIAKGPKGLIFGTVTNGLAGAAYLVSREARGLLDRKFWPSRAEVAQSFRRNASYPRYSIWEALANSASIQLPILLIGMLAGERELGLLVYGMSVIQAPLSLLGSASAQIFSSKAPERARKGELRAFIFETLRTLSWIGIAPILAIGLLSPWLFVPLFGLQWERSGILVLWMTPWFLAQFLGSPTSMTMHIIGRHRMAMAVQLGGLALRTLAVLLAFKFLGRHLAEAYAISGAIAYAFLLGIGIVMSGRHDERMRRVTQ